MTCVRQGWGVDYHLTTVGAAGVSQEDIRMSCWSFLASTEYVWLSAICEHLTQINAAFSSASILSAGI